MGFMDKAKKLAADAQAKADQVQQDFNDKQAAGGGAGPAVEYDQHGRPIRGAAAEAPHPDPAAAAPDPGATPHPDPEPETATPPHGDPFADAPAPPSAPPKPPAGGSGMTSGDPLAG